MHTYIPRGVCSRQIDVELDGDTIKSVQFTGGCDGNLKAISKLVAGQNVDDIVAMMEGHTCGRRSTSCVDQMTKAIREAQASRRKGKESREGPGHASGPFSASWTSSRCAPQGR